MKNFGVIFVTVLLAELGDKTQLATMLYTTDKTFSPLLVFLAASMALVCSTGIAVFAGSSIGRIFAPSTIKLIAGISFIAIGIYTVATTRS